jgi:small subunit ribosomal protein S6
MIEFRAVGGLIQKIETEFKRDERIIRFLVVGLEKYAVAYAERKRARKKAEKEKIKEE